MYRKTYKKVKLVIKVLLSIMYITIAVSIMIYHILHTEEPPKEPESLEKIL